MSDSLMKGFEHKVGPAISARWNQVWWCDKPCRRGYITEWVDELGVFYVTIGTATKSDIAAGPFADFDAAAVVFFLLTPEDREREEELKKARALYARR